MFDIIVFKSRFPVIHSRPLENTAISSELFAQVWHLLRNNLTYNLVSGDTWPRNEAVEVRWSRDVFLQDYQNVIGKRTTPKFVHGQRTTHNLYITYG